MKIHSLSGVFVAVVAVAVMAAPHGNDNHHRLGHPAEVKSAPEVSKNPWVRPQVTAVRMRREDESRTAMASMSSMVDGIVSRIIMTTMMSVAYAGATYAINATTNQLGVGHVFESGSHITGFIWRMSPIIDKVLGY